MVCRINRDGIILEDRILIIGNGLLGSEFIKRFSDSDAYYTYRNNIPQSEKSEFLDITNKNELRKVILDINPDIVIHTAAITDLDWCENNEDEAYNVNTNSTVYIKNVIQEINSKMIFISTDSVFDGKIGNYEEDSEKNAINVYSKTKLKAEKEISSYNKTLIVRGTFYGLRNGMKESFFSYLINKLKKNEKIRVPVNKISNGISVEKFSGIVKEMIERDLRGVYHIGSNDFKNNFEFAQHFAHKFNFNRNLIERCVFDEIYETKKLTAKRPLNTTLDITKISKYIEMPYFSQVIDSLYNEFFSIYGNRLAR